MASQSLTKQNGEATTEEVRGWIVTCTQPRTSPGLLQTDLQRLVWDVNGFFLKEGKMLCFQIKSTCLIALLYSLLFARVSGRFEAFSAS